MDATALPPAARDKLAALEQARADAEALLAAGTGRLAGLQAQADNLVELAGRTADPVKRAGLESEVKAAVARMDSAREEIARRSKRRGSVAQLTTRLAAWLRDQPASMVFEAIPASPLAIEPGETIAQAVERIREQRRQARADLTGLALAPPTRDELRQQAKRHFNDLKERGKPRLAAQGNQLVVHWRTRPSNFTHAEVDDYMASLAWLFPDQVEKRLLDEVDKMPQRHAISTSERRSREKELRALLAKLEYDEESLITEAERHDIVISRRPDADPKAVLGIRIASAVKADAA